MFFFSAYDVNASPQSTSLWQRNIFEWNIASVCPFLILFALFWNVVNWRAVGQKCEFECERNIQSHSFSSHETIDEFKVHFMVEKVWTIHAKRNLFLVSLCRSLNVCRETQLKNEITTTAIDRKQNKINGGKEKNNNISQRKRVARLTTQFSHCKQKWFQWEYDCNVA